MRGKETRERILEAAIKVISDETIEGLSTRKVSSEANVNLAAIHYHHRSKEGMLIDLARYLMMNYITPKLESCMVNGKKPKELFADIYRSIESLYDENPEVLISFVYLWLHGRKSGRIKEIILNSREQLTENLSGGNQQKVILSRWLSEDIDVFLMDEPTRGIDVGAKYEIYKIMYNLASEGKGILFISSDLPEVMGVSDRLVVMRSGEIIGILDREEFTEEKILSMALPVS